MYELVSEDEVNCYKTMGTVRFNKKQIHLEDYALLMGRVKQVLEQSPSVCWKKISFQLSSSILNCNVFRFQHFLSV